jgi:hypothetical protein
VVLRYVEGLAYQEICEVLGLPVGTVKTNLHRARKELAEAMRAAGWGSATGPGSGGRETHLPGAAAGGAGGAGGGTGAGGAAETLSLDEP